MVQIRKTPPVPSRTVLDPVLQVVALYFDEHLLRFERVPPDASRSEVLLCTFDVPQWPRPLRFSFRRYRSALLIELDGVGRVENPSDAARVFMGLVLLQSDWIYCRWDYDFGTADIRLVHSLHVLDGDIVTLTSKQLGRIKQVMYSCVVDNAVKLAALLSDAFVPPEVAVLGPQVRPLLVSTAALAALRRKKRAERRSRRSTRVSRIPVENLQLTFSFPIGEQGDTEALFDVRDEVLEHFGPPILCHGDVVERVSARCHRVLRMVVIGVCPDTDGGVPTVYFLPEGWSGAGVMDHDAFNTLRVVGRTFVQRTLRDQMADHEPDGSEEDMEGT